MKTSIALLTLLTISLQTGIASAQSANPVVGVWEHASNVNMAADGKKTDTFGSNPKGMAIFTADGHFMIVNLRADLPKYAANNRLQGTAEENKATVQGSIGFYGTYSLDPKAINLKIEGSTYPNWTGSQQKRDLLSVTGDEMKWKVAASMGGQSEVTWKRMK